MRRTPVAIGRMINLTSEILANADRDLAVTFFKNSISKFTQTYLFLVLRELKLLLTQIKATVVFMAFVDIASRN